MPKLIHYVGMAERLDEYPARSYFMGLIGSLCWNDVALFRTNEKAAIERKETGIIHLLLYYNKKIARKQ